jgi:hypothetical protein
LVVRFAVALLLAVVLLHVRIYFRGDPLWDPPSAFENALAPERVAPKFDASLVKLRGELVDSVKSRSYFDRVLWPHLQAIAVARHSGGDEIEPPPKGRLSWRGPSASALAALISRLSSCRWLWSLPSSIDRNSAPKLSYTQSATIFTLKTSPARDETTLIYAIFNPIPTSQSGSSSYRRSGQWEQR